MRTVRDLVALGALVLLLVALGGPFEVARHWDSPSWWAWQVAALPGQVAALPGQVAEWWPW